MEQRDRDNLVCAGLTVPPRDDAQHSPSDLQPQHLASVCALSSHVAENRWERRMSEAG